MKILAFIMLAPLILITQGQGKTAGSQHQDNSRFEFYVVKNGETEEDVAQKFGVTVADLRKWNNLDEPVSDGRILSIDKRYIKKTEAAPAKEKIAEEKPVIKSNKSESSSYHTVQPGETLYHISRIYNMPVKELMDLNNLKNINIKEGQKLRVKNHPVR